MDDDRQVAAALSVTPVSARELELRLGVSERRISSALGRLRKAGMVERRSTVCPHCAGRGRLTSWKAARALILLRKGIGRDEAATHAAGLVQRPQEVDGG